LRTAQLVTTVRLAALLGPDPLVDQATHAVLHEAACLLRHAPSVHPGHTPSLTPSLLGQHDGADHLVIVLDRVREAQCSLFRWLTVTSPDGLECVELVLDPPAFAPAKSYHEALFAADIPAAAFITHHIHGDIDRLRNHGVVF
jgi:hypothetical protein